jgi:hypothetical protein
MGLFAHHGNAMGAVAQRTEPGNVVGMQMGVDGFDQVSDRARGSAADSDPLSPAPDR